jgi:hypothetical protein
MDNCIAQVDFIETYLQVFTRDAWKCYYQMLHYTGSRGWMYDLKSSAPLNSDSILRLQEIVGTFLYYAQAVDSCFRKDTANAITHLLNYAATNPDATVRYIASKVVPATD